MVVASITTWAQQAPPQDLSGTELRNWLKTNWFEGYHKTLHYSGSNNVRSYMYGYIDKREDGKLVGVYTGYSVDASYSTTNVGDINCEHTVCQGFFDSKEPMVSDIHHLYPSYNDANSLRNNYPLRELDDNTVTTKWIRFKNGKYEVLTTKPTSDLDSYSEYTTKGNSFEPREEHKGDCARAVFYFFTMYPDQMSILSKIGDINTFYQWHLSDPVDAWEKGRNGRVKEIQGNSNPYIEHPELVAKAWGFDVGATDIISTKSLKIDVYPNPTGDNLYFLKNINSNSAITICNLYGQVVKNIIVTTQTNSISVSNLNSGIYIIKIKEGNNIYTSKFIKK